MEVPPMTDHLVEGLRIERNGQSARIEKIRTAMVCLRYDNNPKTKFWIDLVRLKYELQEGKVKILGQ